MSTEIQNVNTSQTVAPSQTPAGSAPAVSTSNPTILDIELQKILQKLGITIEQWNAMSPQDQANTKAQYAQIQQEIAIEQSGMGVTGLHVEHTEEGTKPTATQPAATPINPATTEQSTTAEGASTSTVEHPSSSDDSKRAQEKDPSWLEWKIKTNENKRNYLKKKAIESGHFEGKTDEEIEQILNNYFEYKTKERLAQKNNNISDEDWQKLTDEEKLKMMDETWNAIPSEKKRRKEINETINDYTLMVSSNLTFDEYKNLTKTQKSLLELKGKEEEIAILKSMGAENFDNLYHEVLKGAQSNAKIEATNLLTSVYASSGITSSGKYDNIINDALANAGIDNSGNLESGVIAEHVAEYMKAELEKAQNDDEYNNMLADMASSIMKSEGAGNTTNALLVQVLTKNGWHVSDVIELLDNEEFRANYEKYVENVALNGTMEAQEYFVVFTEAIEEEANNIADLEKRERVIAAFNSSTEAYMQGVLIAANSDDSQRSEVAQKGHLRSLQSSSNSLKNIAVNAVNKNNSKGADKLFGNFALVSNSEAQKWVNDGLRDKSAETQRIRTENLVKANPASKKTYDLINGATEDGIYHKDAQQPVTDIVTKNAKKYLSEEDSKQVHKEHFDAAAVGFNAENQDYVYEAMMNSGYTEVQEYAASNIYKLDESIRDWAEEYTKSLNIESVTNAIQTEPPVNVDNNTSSENSFYETNNNIITTAEVNTVNNTIQEIKAVLVNEETGDIRLDLNNQEDRSKLIELFEQHPIEMAKYIEKAPLKNKEALLIALCQSSKTVAVSFVKQNPSLGLIILSSSQVELGVQRDVALAMLQKADKGSDVWRTASEFIGKFYKGETTLPEAPKKSIAFKA